MISSNRYRVESVLLGVIVVFYLWVLNWISNHNIVNIYLSLMPTILFLLIILLSSLLPKILYKIILSFMIFLASITIFFKWRYQVTITEDILLSGMINDAVLTQEMFSYSLLIWVVLTALFPILILTRMHLVKVSIKKYLIMFFGIFLLLVSVVLLQGYEYRAKGQIRDYKSIQAIGSFSPLDLLYAFKKAYKAKQNLEKEYMSAKNSIREFKLSNDEDRLIILIVGESTRGDHFSINGYNKLTSPKLSNIDNLYSFKKVKSCDTLTIRSMHYMFSPLSCDSDDSKVTDASFVSIMHRLGYRVELFSLQTLNAFYHYLEHDKLISKYAVIREQKTGTRDISLLPYIKQSIENFTHGKKLIIVHTLGSHQSYIDRVGIRNEYFKPLCRNADVSVCKQAELVNTYDNTIVAIDDFLSQVISMAKDKKAMLVYVSDHGESLGEDGYYFHGKPRDEAPSEQFDIPFMFWFSDSYKSTKEIKAFKEQWDIQKQDRNITHDYLYHSMLGCSGIVSDDGEINSKLNLCSNKSNF